MEASAPQKIPYRVVVGFGDSRNLRVWKVWARTPGEARVAAQEKARWLLTVSVDAGSLEPDSDFDDEFDA